MSYEIIARLVRFWVGKCPCGRLHRNSQNDFAALGRDKWRKSEGISGPVGVDQQQR